MTMERNRTTIKAIKKYREALFLTYGKHLVPSEIYKDHIDCLIEIIEEQKKTIEELNGTSNIPQFLRAKEPM